MNCYDAGPEYSPPIDPPALPLLYSPYYPEFERIRIPETTEQMGQSYDAHA